MYSRAAARHFSQPLLQRPSHTASKMAKFDIEIVSDTICPWCYVGKQKLDKAIKLHKERNPGSADEFNITWKPFYLIPGLPNKGTDKHQYYLSRFGADRLKAMSARLSQIGLDNGINFKYGGTVGNTRNSHRLIALAGSKSPALQSRTVAELFKSYFENEGDLTDLANLQAAGVRAGLDEVEVKKWLESDGGGKEVDRNVEEAQIRGISGVPNFTINGRYEVGGAQDSAVFLDLFDRIAKSGEADVKGASDAGKC